MSSDSIGKLVASLDKRYERSRTPVMDAIIDSVTRNDKYQIIGATARIQGTPGTPIQVGANMASLSPGQMFVAENLGTAASPMWSIRGAAASGNVAAPRVVEFGEDYAGYGGGDLLLGDDSWGMPNFFFDESAGTLQGRMGTVPTLGLDARSGRVFVGQEDHGHVEILSGGVYVTYDQNLAAIAIEPTGLSLYSHSPFVQRGFIKTDGTGWLVADDKFVWDADGNISIAGNFQADTLIIGNAAGPAIRGGTVKDFDLDGMPLSPIGQMSLSVVDNSGLPRIRMVTGTVDHPDTAALFVGRETDPAYLWFEGGHLKIAGEAEIASGSIGGFALMANRIQSTSRLVIITNQEEQNLREGIHLVAGGSIIGWRRLASEETEQIYTATISADRVEDRIGGRMLRINATDPVIDGGNEGVVRLQFEVFADSAEGGGELGKLTLTATDTGNEMKSNMPFGLGYLKPNRDIGPYINITGVEQVVWVDGGDFVYQTNQGNTGRMMYNLTGIECVSGALPMTWKLNVPKSFAGNEPNVKKITMHWRKTLAGSYFSNVELVQTNTDNTSSSISLMTNLGSGTAIGNYTTVITDVSPSWPTDKTPASRYIKLSLAGVTDYGHIKVFGFEVIWGN